MKQFKGQINGVEFTDVKEYSDALAKAIKEDNLHSFASSYEYCNCNCDKAGKHDVAVIEEPKFDASKYIHNFNFDHLMDKIKDDKVYEDWLNLIDEERTQVKSIIDAAEFNQEELDALDKALDERYARLHVIDDKNQQALKTVEKRIEDLEHEIDGLCDKKEVLLRAKDAVHELDDYFEDIDKYIADKEAVKLKELKAEQERLLEEPVAAEPVKEEKDVDFDKLGDTLLDGYKRLLKAIFA